MATPRQLAAQKTLADAYRRDQQTLNQGLLADLLRLLRALFSTDDAEQSWAALRPAIRALVATQSQRSADLAATYYLRTRQAAGVTTPFRPIVQGPPADELIDATIDSTGLGSYLHDRKMGRTAAQAQRRAEVNLAGAVSRLTQQAGRETVQASSRDDRAAIGWMRVTDADPCYWCAMLASRGVVYKSRATAGAKYAGRFDGVNPYAFHNHCECSAVPVMSDQDPRIDAADELYDRWLDVTSDEFGKDKLRAWRRHWESKGDGDGSAVG